ncbi:urea amidolyase family protein [Microbacterium soli]|uniref:Urea amidolyase family protein n=1 Tax=Microbacterium soli TaxID=446075 RepID=A0ABP7N2I9_9MICO
MRILTASDRALLVEASDLDEAMRLNLAWEGTPGVVERIPGARTVLVRFDPSRISARRLAAVLRETAPTGTRMPATGEVTIPVQYDGEDLDEVAAMLGVSTEEVVRRHQRAGWRVAFSGFAPGFGYLIGDDPLFDVARRATPRTRVPAGAVALAGRFTGVYPRSSPGGWQLIGRTEAVMWDIDRDPPALLTPGTSVRFTTAQRGRIRPAERSAGGDLRENPAGEAGGRSLEVIRPSLQLLVQDPGRPGYAALGVSASGTADRTAMRDANRAVGNPPGAAVLESVGGAELRFRLDGVVAVAGAIGDLTLMDADGIGRSAPHGAPFAVSRGDGLVIGEPTHGLRSVIAVRGGILAERALGSAATDTLAGLGPAPLRAGDVLRIGPEPRQAVDPHPLPRALPASGDLVELEITAGPRDDWFTPAAVAALTGQDWTVTPRSDRVGIRLHGEEPLARAVAGELPSEGAVTGALQVPADGQPVLFLADHPLTGGYPIIAALTDRCLDLAGQLPPGARIRFRRVDAGR